MQTQHQPVTVADAIEPARTSTSATPSGPTTKTTATDTHSTCGGEVVVLGTRLLSGSAHGCCLLNLKESEEQNEVLEAEEKESEVDGGVEERVTQRVHET